MKKILYILIIIALVVAGIFVAKQMSEENEITQTGANTFEKKDNTDEENIMEENKTVEPEENKVANDNTENIENNNVETETNELAPEEPEEQAKQIVKENWGEDDSVYYSYDGKDEQGRYVICVREKSTTKELYRYYVNIETGSFDIE